MKKKFEILDQHKRYRLIKFINGRGYTIYQIQKKTFFKWYDYRCNCGCDLDWYIDSRVAKSCYDHTIISKYIKK